LYEDCGASSLSDYYRIMLLVERHPYWEAPSYYGLTGAIPTAAAAVAYDYTAGHDIRGDVAARIAALSMRSGGIYDLYELWMGIRGATKHSSGAVTNFIPVWEAEDGVTVNDTAADGGGTEPNTASPGGGAGDYLRIVENLVDWDDGDDHISWYTDVNTAGYANPADADGKFLWLLRAKVTAGEWRVRMRLGLNYQWFTLHEPVSVSNTNWYYYELGVASLPFRNVQVLDRNMMNDDTDGACRVAIYAQRISGAGNLLMDCLVTIPVDEGYLHITIASMSSTHECLFAQGPSEATQCLAVVPAATDYLNNLPPYDFENFRLPPGDGRIICSYARYGSSVLTDQIEFSVPNSICNVGFVERWLSLRGAE
jgi:hypothetical protein